MDNLVNSVDDTKQFWKTLKRNISNSHFPCSDISQGQSHQHYDSIGNKELEKSVDLFLQDHDKTVISTTEPIKKTIFHLM